MTSKKNYIFICLGIFTCIGISFLLLNQHKTKVKNTYAECNPVLFANAPISPSNKLNDKNDIHLIHAIRNGLKQPFINDQDFNLRINELIRKSILVEVKENCYFQLKSLTNSQPYLIPEAIDMVNEIGFRFQERLKEKGYKNYRFRITSLLRTEEAQDELSHRNRNATVHSSHLYGTTVDISYKNFYNTQTDSIESSYEAVQTLTSVLVEMRKECKFLAVRERKQSCFHITVVVCRPLE
jgi:hypothetical protein